MYVCMCVCVLLPCADCLPDISAAEPATWGVGSDVNV